MFSKPIDFSAGGAVAIYHVSGTTAFALGHYPGDPIFPGVLSLHLMQQLAEAFAYHLTGTQHVAKGIKRVSYLSLVRPGDTVMVECDPPAPHAVSRQHIIKARLSVDDVLTAKSEFYFNIPAGD